MNQSHEHEHHTCEHQTTSERETKRRMGARDRTILSVVVLAAAYLIIAYLVLPAWWIVYVDRHPALEEVPNITYTSDGIPGDPLNVGLVGSKEAVIQAMGKAGWHPAAALGLRSDLKIAADTVFSQPDTDAPVSSLYLFHRKEDLALEQPVGDNPRKRHHVRFWQSDKLDEDGRPLWLGSATYDERVGLSHTTGQITHHISGDVDQERDHLMESLAQAKELSNRYYVDDFHKVRSGKNGGGDKWTTDGRLEVGVIKSADKAME